MLIDDMVVMMGQETIIPVDNAPGLERPYNAALSISGNGKVVSGKLNQDMLKLCMIIRIFFYPQIFFE
jgi:hypothetical protein